MYNLHDLESIAYFQKKAYQKDEVIFNEGEENTFLYIVLEWKLLVDKQISLYSDDRKEIAILQPWDIFWEGSISGSYKKQVRVVCKELTILYYLDTTLDLHKCLIEFPLISFEIFKKIIALTNSRLLVSDREATINYEVTKRINGLEKVDFKSLTSLFDQIANVFWCDYLLYLEKKEFIEHTLVIRYDTRNTGKVENIVITFPDDFKTNILEENGINLWENTFLQRIRVSWEILWYLVFWNNSKDFNDSDHRIAESIANSLVWVLRQKKLLDEERDKNYLKSL